jgi:hypothetical protein
MGHHSSLVGELTNAVLKRDTKILKLEECGVKNGG